MIGGLLTCSNLTHIIVTAESSRAAAPMINWNNDTLVDCWKPTVDPEDVPWMYWCGNDECMKIGDPANDANGAESLARGLILAGTIVGFIGVDRRELEGWRRFQFYLRRGRVVGIEGV